MKMFRQIGLITITVLLVLSGSAQNKNGIVSGPMLGDVEFRDAKLWIEVTPDVKTVSLKCWQKGSDMKAARTINYKGELGNDFNPVKLAIGALEPNTAYQYQFTINGKPLAETDGEFTTKDLWQFRKPVPDFTFLAGSCSYFNEPVYDRPGKPYGNDSSIFNTMAQTPASFMIWLGDNWYTREVDYFSEWGLGYRASHDRATPILQNFWKAMPHYAIWDDHDYGPNDGDRSYILKETSRKIFTNYWCNPSAGENGQGIYTKITHGDADFFLMDDRYFRSADNMQSEIDGQPNPFKRMWGPQQMEWLMNALVNSKATFKFIVTGSQTLNPASPFDCLQHFPAEFRELMSFLKEEKINGVLFLTGDRHHSEVIKWERDGAYPLYDITSSPLTSGIGKVRGLEEKNPARVANTLVEEQNFSKISITGDSKKGERKLTVEFIGIKGNKLGEWSITEKEIKSFIEKR
jgi:alkaline phosphatase D